MCFCSVRILRRFAFFVLLIMFLFLVSSLATHVRGQASTNPVDLSYQAFAQLAAVYRSGGQAPDLVAKLNSAMNTIQDARIKRTQGDVTDAIRLENQAASAIKDVLSAIPAAKENSARDTSVRTATVIGVISIVVLLSTFIFYATLRTWRYYEKLKLYEMRIVEKKIED